MDVFTLAASLDEVVPGAAAEAAPSIDRQWTVYVSAAHLSEIAVALRDRPEWRFALLIDVTAVDFWPAHPRFEVIYLLVSIEHTLRLRLKVRLDGDAPQLPTVSPVWPAANWLEREVWDLFGIEFDGHPDPRRLLMPEDWEGFPLRKDYPVQVNVPIRTTEPTQVTAEEFKATLLRDRLVRRG